MAAGGTVWSELPAGEVLELLQQLDVQGAPAVSGFLDVHQWTPLADERELAVDGGYDSAQFRRAGLAAPPGVVSWRIDNDGLPAELRSARALRRAIEQEFGPGAVGDIHCASHVAVALGSGLDLAELFPRAEKCAQWSQPEMPLLRATAASLRADSVVGALFHVSRGEAQTAIEYGFVYPNFRQLTRRTAQLAEGCELVYRTKGRAQIVSTNETTRSGRVALEYRFFPS